MAKKKSEKKPKIGSWVVRVRCTVDRDVVVENCTEEEARKSPWDCSVAEENDVELRDFDVIDVSPND